MIITSVCIIYTTLQLIIIEMQQVIIKQGIYMRVIQVAVVHIDGVGHSGIEASPNCCQSQWDKGIT